MKGKVLSLKIILSVFVLALAGICFGVGLLPKATTQIFAASTKVSLQTEGKKEEYSALFAGDVIFSVEKVLVSEEYDPDTENVKNFVGTELDAGLKVQEKNFYFKDIQDNAKNKTVVDNGQFVVLQNEIDESGHFVQNKGQTETEREAVMVSFGAYVYFPEEKDNLQNVVSPENVKIANAEKTIYSKITYLDIVLKKDGKEVPKENIPSNRNIHIDSVEDGGLFFDFVYLIEQQKDSSNEGYYEFTLNYMVKNIEYTQSFGFYVVNHLSYTQSLDPTIGYNAAPTLGWTEPTQFEQTATKEGYVRYYIGKSGFNSTQTSYPTITYDYTKYKLSYVHTANHRNTTYDFDYQINESLQNKTAQLNYSVRSSVENYQASFDLDDYEATSSINLVTIMLTEPGTYVVTYDYIYDGYNASVAPELNIPRNPIKLAIHGMSANYSKTGFESAKLQSFDIASAEDNHVDLFVPNGYELTEDISRFKDKELGFVYTRNTTSVEREGNVLTANSVNSLINDDLKENGNFDLLISNLDSLKDVAESIDYVSTNQGSIWIDGNDEFTDNSFYYYSPTKLNADSNSTVKTFSNTSSFNKKGYYLVFVEVKPNGINGESSYYWQVFAFQYTSSSVDIKLEAIDTKGTVDTADDVIEIVAGGKHTNKEVRVSWKKPGIFDRNIDGYYFKALNSNLDRDSLLMSYKTKINAAEVSIDGETYCTTYLGSDVNAGDFIKYLIRLESEGDSATHKIFTVDRQPISGLQAYLVEEMAFGNSVVYALATDKNNQKIDIVDSITDSLAALTWNDKLSGAETFASYSYTPFNQTSKELKNISYLGVETNYELGNSIYGSSLKKAELNSFQLEPESVLFNQGIYIIRVWDSAGNECYYAFIIDKTENYFLINNDLPVVTNTSLIFGDDVEYNIGENKVFELNMDDCDEELKSFIENAEAGTLSNFKENKYYSGSYNNIYAIGKYFRKSAENKYYFVVENERVVGYKDTKELDSSINGKMGKLVYNAEDESSYVRILYAVSKNHQISTNRDEKNNSYVKIEINKDNARGTAYYSNDVIDENSLPQLLEETGNVRRLYTGDNIKGAKATMASHVAFAWNMGVGNFEVESVSYSFYSLKPNSDTVDAEYYFYGSPEEDIPLYSSGTIRNDNNAYLLTDGRGVVYFNASSDSREGLYVVTRKYREDLAVDLGDDAETKNYYFIIDRNGIIDLSQGIGSNIKLNLLENEIEFTEFSTGGTEVQTFSNIEDKIDNQRYNVYLATSKLPTVMNIPTGKYFNSKGNSAGYYAGKLNVSVYFKDTEKQLGGSYKGTTQKIFDSQTDLIDVTSKDGIFSIDIYKYLTEVDSALRDRLTESSTNGTWLFLSGDYIIKITDNVNDVLNKTHEKYIGLRITGYQNPGPKVESFTGFAEDEMQVIKIKQEYSLDKTTFIYFATVSQEYLKVQLPSYKDGEFEKAQVDPNYVVVKQFAGHNSPGIDYINHPYSVQNGIKLDENSERVTVEDGVINLWLDTQLLRNKETNEIDSSNFNTPLYYTVTVRYKIGNGENNEKFEKCYYYYKNIDDTTQNRVKFYEVTYTIRIDREAPSKNITFLNDSDALVEEYNELFGSDNMIENGVHETSSNLYFTKQYTQYYKTGKSNKGYIYAYQVDNNTSFDPADVDKVYFKQIENNDISSYNLTLPLINDSKYTIKTNLVRDQITTYSFLLNAGYYEIVEMDAAGNATQYVVHYKPSNSDKVEVDLPVALLTSKQNVIVYGTLGLNGFEAMINPEDSETESISIFDIFAIDEAQITNRQFVKIELKYTGGNNVDTILTTSTTDFDNINSQIVDAIKAEKSGNFTLKISFRSIEGNQFNLTTKEFRINLYDESNILGLDVKKLVKVIGGDFYIDLAGANIQNEDKTLWFFAQEITIESSVVGDDVAGTYYGRIEADGRIVYIKQGQHAPLMWNILSCQKDSTYYIVMSDGIHPEPYRHRFRTTEGESYFYKTTFVNPTNGDSYGDYYTYISLGDNEELHYGYTSARVEYDPTFTARFFINTEGRWSEIINIPQNDPTKDYYRGTNGTYKTINIQANYQDYGRVAEYKVEIYATGEAKADAIHYVTIDTTIESIALRDYNSGEQRNHLLNSFENKRFDDESVSSTISGSGTMNLQWTKKESEYFNYVYTLYELKKDESDGYYVTYDLTNVSNYVIATKEDSKGIYKFEIAVYNLEGVFIGNKIYAFEVQQISTQVYYVKNESGVAIKENSSFVFADLTENLKPQIVGEINEIITVPLYVTNETLTVVVTAMNVEISQVAYEETDRYNFTIYKLSKENSFNIFVGVLKVKSTDNLLTNAVNLVKEQAAINESQQIGEKTTFTIAGEPADKISINSSVNEETNPLLKKNLLLMDVKYNNILVRTEVLNDYISEGVLNYPIKGNGQYTFEIKDLAGNVHKFENGSKINVYALREVVVRVNNETPIENAFYNEEVEVSINASNIFITGSINVAAYKNGEPYYYEGFNPYIFRNYGNYRVVITARYAGLENPLKTVISFTILNVKEARKSIDLTSLNGNKITKVTNMYGEDKTQEFLEIINGNNGGMNISYEKIIENADKLNVTAGKVTFTVSYLVEDGVYPSRDVEFSFTLNNETPQIECSLENGKSTKKNFKIYFNAAILYEQIGEAYIYINDRMVAHIDENSANSEVSVETSFKEHGDGDYYIELVSSSGVVWDSYKVTIKEPLNFWAVVVILVIVGVVGTVVITIVVLRRRMRIR